MKKTIDTQQAKQSCITCYDDIHDEYLNKCKDELLQKPFDKTFLEKFATRLRKNSIILDIGCSSSAQQARFFKQNGFEVTAIDVSKQCIDTARKNFTGIDFKHMDMLEMRFADASFDGICAFYSIIHISDENLDELFRQCNRILRVEGRMCISVHLGNFMGLIMKSNFRCFSEHLLQLN